MQRLALGCVIIGDVCINGAHKPSPVNVFRTYILKDKREFHEPNKIEVKKDISHTSPLPDPPISHLERQSLARSSTGLTSEAVFHHTKNDNLAFLRIMEKEIQQDESNSWVSPLPFRSPRHRLPNKREQASHRLVTLTSSLRKQLSCHDGAVCC